PSSAANWLRLAAAPTFVVMELLVAVVGGRVTTAVRRPWGQLREVDPHRLGCRACTCYNRQATQDAPRDAGHCTSDVSWVERSGLATRDEPLDGGAGMKRASCGRAEHSDARTSRRSP